MSSQVPSPSDTARRRMLIGMRTRYSVARRGIAAGGDYDNWYAGKMWYHAWLKELTNTIVALGRDIRRASRPSSSPTTGSVRHTPT